MKFPKNTLLQGALVSLALTSGLALANSTLVAPAAAGATASASLDFRVVIPRVLYIRIGASGAGFTTGGAINLMDMSPAAANVGNGTAVAATGGDVPAGGSAVTVRIFGNAGTTLSLNSFTNGQLNNGTVGQNIPWTEITVTPAALAATTPGFTNGVIAHPTFNNAAGGGNGTATALAPTAGVVRVEGQWAIAYANTGVPASGTYGGGPVNGRVVYTVTQP